MRPHARSILVKPVHALHEVLFEKDVVDIIVVSLTEISDATSGQAEGVMRINEIVADLRAEEVSACMLDLFNCCLVDRPPYSFAVKCTKWSSELTSSTTGPQIRTRSEVDIPDMPFGSWSRSASFTRRACSSS
jgi:hypothetical protein